jgi:hypothetical protein
MSTAPSALQFLDFYVRRRRIPASKKELARMEAKGLDTDSLPPPAPGDRTSAAVEFGRSGRNQLLPNDNQVNGLSDTGMLRALQSETVPSLDDLRRLSAQIREGRQPKQAAVGKKQGG